MTRAFASEPRTRPTPRPALFWPRSPAHRWLLGLLLLLGLALRLQVWHWHEMYPLGGDETEYFNQALTFLRGEGYQELRLMRPPGYPVFLAVVFRLFDSQVQRVRLVQALISTAGIYLQWLLVRLALARATRDETAPLLGAALAAASFTLAANATELLTETLFVFGLMVVLCLLLAADQEGRRTQWLLVAAGVSTGLLALLRSVALPLLPLGAAWLLLREVRPPRSNLRWALGQLGWRRAATFAIAGALVIAPWTVRNYLRYDHLIVVDTTGAENLWLDNDPAGREAVKQQLYAMGEDRGARQALAMERGMAVIGDAPARFLNKTASEARKLVALEYWDDLRQRPAIWVPPFEVWLRLLLGDGIWLLLAIAGGAGLASLQPRLQWLFVPWVLYVVLTSLVFHVELRYRLPLYPVMIVAAAALLAPAGRAQLRTTLPRGVVAVASIVLVATLMLLHRPYLHEATMLAAKHWHLWRDDGAQALRADPASALARVRLARDELAHCGHGPCPAAEELLREAIEVKPAHPYAHLLLGGLLRARGDQDAARAALEYETASLEDLQHWMATAFGPRPTTELDIGNGLDLGNIAGFHSSDDGFRWTTSRATIWLAPSPSAELLQLRLAHGRPAEAAAGRVSVRIGVEGQELARIEIGREWEIVEVPLPPEAGSNGGDLIEITIAAETFRLRVYNPASDDNRVLGVKMDWIGLAGRS